MTGAGGLLGGCGGWGGDTDRPMIDWWHISPAEPMFSTWAGIARDYQQRHHGVTVKIAALENEAYKARLARATRAGDPPDIFHTWGGGLLRQQRDAGLLTDVAADVASWGTSFTAAAQEPYRVDGRLCAVPFDVGMVGFWYNKDLFSRARVEGVPRTWREFLEVVGRLKAAGVTPIALAGRDRWPGHYYWAYLAMRIAGVDVLRDAGVRRSFAHPGFVEAGRYLQRLVALEPFQEGFLRAGYGGPVGQAAVMCHGGAAMELMGQWAPTAQDAFARERGGLGEALGFFPFPAVEGGEGAVTDALGGGGGFAVGRDAPPEALDFLRYISRPEIVSRTVRTRAFLPVVDGTEAAVADVRLEEVVAVLSRVTRFQLYLDQAYPPEVGRQVNDSVAELIAGRAVPEQVTAEVTEAARRQ